MADAQVSGTCGGNTMWVQLPSPAPTILTKKSFLRKTNPYCMQWCMIDFDTGYSGGRKDKTKILKGIRKWRLF